MISWAESKLGNSDYAGWCLSFVFYDCICMSGEGPVNWGHCGISLGDGRVIHAWDVVKEDDYMDIEKLISRKID